MRVTEGGHLINVYIAVSYSLPVTGTLSTLAKVGIGVLILGSFTASGKKSLHRNGQFPTEKKKKKDSEPTITIDL